MSKRATAGGACAAAMVVAAAICVMLGARGAAAQAGDVSAKVDAYVAQQMREQRIPGLSLAVVRDGKIIKVKGYGYADLEFNAPVTPETKFESGSIGKQFTATAVMMLIEEGKIGLEDKITKYFPDAPATWNNITIRNLLSHTSGIKNYTDASMDYRKDYTEDELMKMAEKPPLDFAPGTDWKYSNTGFVVLGILIHKVTGEFYGDFLHQRIFVPLGMGTRVISESDIVPYRASGYTLVKGQWKNQDWVSPTLNTTADGSLYFTTLDMAKWDAELYTTKLLKESSLDEMWTIQKYTAGPNAGKPNKGNYGFGWFINSANGHRLIEHSGAWQGFTDSICRYVDDKLTVIVLTNLDSEHSDPDKIAHTVAGIYVPAVAPPPPPKQIEDKDPAVTAELREVIGQLAAGKLDLSKFTPVAQKRFDANLQNGAKNLLENEDALGKLELLSRKEENGMRTFTYRAHFAYGTSQLVMRLAADGKIQGLGFGDD
jgi:CubicO group peptidase (beta-lactamase class C family)